MYTIPTADIFDAFAYTLGVEYDYKTFCFYFIGSGLGACSALPVSPISNIPGWLGKPFLHPVQDPTTKHNFQIIGLEAHDIARTIKESIYIRVNNPTLNINIGKFNLHHMWDSILLNTPGVQIKGNVQAIGNAQSNQPNYPCH